MSERVGWLLLLLMRKVTGTTPSSPQDTGPTEEEGRQLLLYIRILDSRVRQTSMQGLADEQIAQVIKTKLAGTQAKEGRAAARTALEFAESAQRMHSAGALRHPGALLRCLFALRFSSSSSLPSEKNSVGGSSSLRVLSEPPQKDPPKEMDPPELLNHASPLRGHETRPSPPKAQQPSVFGASVSQSKKKGKQPTEHELIRDLLFVFQGSDGRFLYVQEGTSAYSLRPGVIVDRPTSQVLGRLAELGWLCRSLQSFLNENDSFSSLSSLKGMKPQDGGACFEGLKGAIRQELSHYYRLVAVLEGQVVRPHLANEEQGLTLLSLLIFTQQPIARLHFLLRLVNQVQDLRGGQLTSAVCALRHHGNPLIGAVAEEVAKSVVRPVTSMVEQWILEGRLNDPLGEFFVMEQPLENSGNVGKEIDGGNWWNHAYVLRSAMIPSFFSVSYALQILRVGKSIHFLRKCHDTKWFSSIGHHSALSESSLLLSDCDLQVQDNDGEEGESIEGIGRLKRWVVKADTLVSQRVLSQLRLHRLNSHLSALKSYLLLSNGDFSQLLMERIHLRLSRPASAVHGKRHDLQSTLETTIRTSSFVHDDEMIDRIGVQLLDAPPNILPQQKKSSSPLTGWDIFSLHYDAPFPINVVVSADATRVYTNIFCFIWKLRRLLYGLTSSWMVSRILLRPPRESQLTEKIKTRHRHFHQYNTLRHRMIHFLTSLQHYVAYEGVEAAWQGMMKDMEKARVLDDVISAHSRFLMYIESKALLSSHLSHQYQMVQDVLAVISRFQSAHVALERAIIQEKDYLSPRFDSLLLQVTTISEGYDAVYRQLKKSALEATHNHGQNMRPEQHLTAELADMMSLS